MLEEDETMLGEKNCLNFFKVQPSKLEKGSSQYLMKQTIGVIWIQRYDNSSVKCFR